MSKLKNIVKNKVKKHSKKFSQFLVIGILKTIFFIYLSWLFIDNLKLPGWIGSMLAIVIVVIFTYLTYRVLKVIKSGFIKYILATFIFNIVTILAITLFVDVIGLTGAMSSTIVSGFLLVIRYTFLNKIGMIQYG